MMPGPSCHGLLRWSSLHLVAGLGVMAVAACAPVVPQRPVPQAPAVVEVVPPAPVVPTAKPALPAPPPPEKPAEADPAPRGEEKAATSVDTPPRVPPRVAALPRAVSPVGPARPDPVPTDPAQVAQLRTRPPMSPPFDGSAEPDTGTDVRCREAVRAARESVNRFRDIPESAMAGTDWVEDALRVTEVALRACRGQVSEEAALYWRATALFLHGQYARAALNYRRVADMQGPFDTLGYARTLAAVLITCAEERQGLDNFRLGGLYEAAGRQERALSHYALAARSTCAPLRDIAHARLKLLAERQSTGTLVR